MIQKDFLKASFKGNISLPGDSSKFGTSMRIIESDVFPNKLVCVCDNETEDQPLQQKESLLSSTWLVFLVHCVYMEKAVLVSRPLQRFAPVFHPRWNGRDMFCSALGKIT